MNKELRIREMTQSNIIKVNSLLSKAALVMLILCPSLVLINYAGITAYEPSQIIKICALIALLSVLPAIVIPRAYDENFGRHMVLGCMELIVCFVQLNPIISLEMLYLLVPLISILYLKKEIFLQIARNCFFAMMFVEIMRTSLVLKDNRTLSTGMIYEQSYERIIPIVLGYVIIMVSLYLVFGHIYDVIVSIFGMDLSDDKKPQVSAQSLIEDEKLTVYNVKGLFLSINQTVQSLIRGKDKTLVVNVDYDLPASLKGKPDQLKLALVNMLSDFLQFTDQGTVTLSVTYEKGITPRKGQNITVICRILCSEDLADKLREGITMGFALAKNIITGMDGIILDKSFGTALRQTCYTVSFLQEVADEETLMIVKQKNRDAQQDLILDSRKKAQNMLFGREVKALVADDSPENQRLVKAILKSYGVTATTVSSGNEALEKLKSRSFDFVLLDHMMPQKGGIQTAKEIRQMDDPYYELLPLMVMSSNVTEDSRQMFMENGFSEVISKPIKEEEMRLAISRIYLT